MARANEQTQGLLGALAQFLIDHKVPLNSTSSGKGLTTNMQNFSPVTTVLTLNGKKVRATLGGMVCINFSRIADAAQAEAATAETAQANMARFKREQPEAYQQWLQSEIDQLGE